MRYAPCAPNAIIRRFYYELPAMSFELISVVVVILQEQVVVLGLGQMGFQEAVN